MTDTPIELDYPFLKEEGIDYIHQLAGKRWTDYGKHDPGITILEELCFGIMDLAYRTNFHIEDLLAKDPDETDQPDEKQCYSAEEILPCNPLTQWDIFKVVLDVSGVKNASVFFSNEPNEIRGGYKVFVELEESIRHTDLEQEVLDLVKQRLYAQRNLCEDFFLITTMQPLPIHIKAHFEADHCLAYEEGEQLIAQVLFEIQSFLSPRIPFYSISQLLDRGKTIDQIFTGPLLTKGFIDEQELIYLKSKSKIYTTDLIASATAVPGIKSVLNFEIFVDQENFNTNTITIPLVKDRFLALNIAESQILLFYNGVNIRTDWEKVLRLLEDMKGKDALRKSYVQEEEVFVLSGMYRNLKEYISLQQDLPLLYNVGHEGCSPSETMENQSKAKQLKGYLMFFDQLFANYLGQLSNIKHVMAVCSNRYNKHDGRIPLRVPSMHSIIKYPTQTNSPGNDLAFVIQRKYLGLNKEIAPIQDESLPDPLTTKYCYYVNKALASDIHALAKRSAMLDHLLAYFAEKFTHDSLNFYADNEEERLKELNFNKSLFLKDYIEISKNRNRAANITTKKISAWEEYRPSGFEQRIYRNLAIKNSQKRLFHEVIRKKLYVEKKTTQSKFDLFLGQDNQVKFDDMLTFKGKYEHIQSLALAYGINPNNYHIIKTHGGTYTILLYVDKNKVHTIELVCSQAIDTIEEAERIIQESALLFKSFNEESEGFHLVEHILLRDGDRLATEEDPYSFRMTLVFPLWPARFQSALFRRSVEEMILTENPAHIATNILWLTLEDMEDFENAYQAWMELKASDAVKTAIDEASKRVMNLIEKFSRDQAVVNG